MTNNLTSDQKLDYIYKTLRNQKRLFILKIFFKILIFIWILYFIFIIIPSYNKDKIYKDISKNISDLIIPIVTDMVKDMNLGWWTNIVNNTWLSDEIIKRLKENPEILDKLINK
jgi:uncharacterized membrane protein (DUF485 family)